MTHCVCGRKKLPFAGYSVVKEPPEAPAPLIESGDAAIRPPKPRAVPVRRNLPRLTDPPERFWWRIPGSNR